MVKTLRIMQVGPGGKYVVHALEGFKIEATGLSKEEAEGLVKEITARNDRLGIRTSVVCV